MAEAQNQTVTPRPEKSNLEKPSSSSATALWQRGWVIVAGSIALAGLLFVCLGYLAETFTYESTDDAFLDADFVSVAPRVGGQVRKVLVADNQKVNAGDLLAEIDPADLQVELDQKQAALEAARANVGLLKATVELFRTQIATTEATAQQSAAEANASEANAAKAAADLKRAEELIHNHTIAAQEYDTAKAAADAAEANLKAAQQKAASDRSKTAQSMAQLEAGLRAYERGQAQTRQSEAEAQTGRLNLSYTRVLAPESGFVTKKAVQAGGFVQPGQKLLALVPNSPFVTANFKETQLKQIRPGQPVRIDIDSVAGGPFAGHVESIMAGSGARFSLLPPENAVGNYVKVVQRIPVKILFEKPFDTTHVLGPGMSVVPSVHVTSYEVPEWALVLGALVLAFGLNRLWARAAKRKMV
jgi:membrane fusion protein, multidrug efflux system